MTREHIEASFALATATHAHAYVRARLERELRDVADEAEVLKLYGKLFLLVLPAFETMNREAVNEPLE